MNLYSCDGHRSLRAESLNDAGEQFARIKANRLGKNGTVATCRMDSWTRNGASALFQACIGTYDRASRTTIGHNEWFHVSRVQT